MHKRLLNISLVTGVHIGAEGEGAILNVKRKTEDLQVAGRDESQHPVPADVTRVVDVDVRAGLGNIIIHTAGRERERKTQ